MRLHLRLGNTLSLRNIIVQFHMIMLIEADQYLESLHCSICGPHLHAFHQNVSLNNLPTLLTNRFYL